MVLTQRLPLAGAQSFAPEAGSVNTATGVVTNVDYRSATIPVVDSSSYNVGDKVTFSNGGTPIYAVGASDKTNTGVAKTFTIVDKPDGTSITVYPKPIAADDGALTAAQKAYANVDTTITNGATVDRVNTDASVKSNLFFDGDAVEVLGGSIPAELMNEFNSAQTITSTLSNGLTLYMMYDGNIADMTFRYRCFLWYGVTIADPQRVGVATRF